RGGVHRLAREGAVEVDHVQVAKALRLEHVRLRGGIAVEHGGAAHVALLEPHAHAFFEIDRGKQDHGRFTLRGPSFETRLSGAPQDDVSSRGTTSENWQSARGRDAGSSRDGIGCPAW